MLGAVLTLAALVAAAGAAPAPCYCVPAGQCGGFIHDFEKKEPAKCVAGGGECCDLDNLPEAEVEQPGGRRPRPSQPEPDPTYFQFEGFEPARSPLEDLYPLPRPEPDPEFDIQLPEGMLL